MKAPNHHRHWLAPLSLSIALLCAAAILTPPPAWMSSASAQNSEDIEQAKARFREAKEQYSEENYLEAARAFREAYELSGRGEILYNVGRAYWKAGQLTEAEEYFQQYLNQMPDADNADAAVEAIIEIQEEMAAQMANVDVSTSRAGVDIFVDDELEPRCQTPCTVSILPGRRTLHARPDGIEPQSKRVDVEPEEQTSIEFVLPGKLLVLTDQRSGTMRVDEVGSWSLPLEEAVPVPSGTHTVRVEGADGSTWKNTVEISGGETTRVMVPLEQSGGGQPSLVQSASYGLVGVSVGLLIGGIALGSQASKTHAALERQQQALGGVDADLVERGKSEKSSANLMYALSAVTFASGAGLFTWDLMSSSSDDEEEIPPSEPDAEDADVDLLDDDSSSEDEDEDELEMF
jgi:tetratricopeptide (TPR) repeat protein